jgi:hypothetical protein
MAVPPGRTPAGAGYGPSNMDHLLTGFDSGVTRDEGVRAACPRSGG